jgi:hypothetical protein
VALLVNGRITYDAPNGALTTQDLRAVYREQVGESTP